MKSAVDSTNGCPIPFCFFILADFSRNEGRGLCAGAHKGAAALVLNLAGAYVESVVIRIFKEYLR